MAQHKEELVQDDAQFKWLNFSGRPTKFNPEGGDKSFGLFIADFKVAEELEKNRWNIKWTDEQDEGEPGRPYVSVAVGYNWKPPTIFTVINGKKKHIDESIVGELDGMEFLKVDVFVTGSEWGFNDKGGIKAWLRTMYAFVNPDPLQLKYADLED